MHPLTARRPRADRPLLSPEQLCERLPDALRCFTFSVVSAMDELRDAAHLVYREYLRRGYMGPNHAQLKLTIFHALPETAVFVAKDPAGHVVGTLTLIPDSPLGLPMDGAYREELNTLRAGGQRLAEASMLALDGQVLRRAGLPIFRAATQAVTLQLFKVMFDYLRARTPTTELAACFHPRHEVLYDWLQLQPLGGRKPYALANGRPAVARHLNVRMTERLATQVPVIGFFYGPARPYPQAHKLMLRPEHLEELFVRTTTVFATTSSAALAHVLSRYPAGTLSDRLPDALHTSAA